MRPACSLAPLQDFHLKIKAVAAVNLSMCIVPLEVPMCHCSLRIFPHVGSADKCGVELFLNLPVYFIFSSSVCRLCWQPGV